MTIGPHLPATAPRETATTRRSEDAGRGIDPAREAELRAVATAFEASFLAEMLKHAGVGRPTPGFDGGAGEAAFGQELVAEQARLMAEQGGIGLAERLVQSMLAREG